MAGRIWSWIKGEEPLFDGESPRHEQVRHRLEESAVVQDEAQQVLDEWNRAVRAMRRRGFPVSDAMRIRHDRR